MADLPKPTLGVNDDYAAYIGALFDRMNDGNNAAWVPVVTAGSGTITTVGTVVANYIDVCGIIFFWLEITITTNGTGATSVNATLPVSAADDAVCSGRATGISGNSLQGHISGGSVVIRNYDDTYPGASGETLMVSGFYRKV